MQILKQIQVPYSFAKRHGVLFRYDGDQVFIIRRQNTEKIALQEARRILGKPAHYQLCTEQEFNTLLSTSYAGDTGESQQVAAGLEDHPDLLSLADQVPETEDLMDQEDDAPIVRLINALLSEAIRVGASDIHIEAFEKKLSVRLRVDGQLREIVQPRRELAPYWFRVLKLWRSSILLKNVYHKMVVFLYVLQAVKWMCVFQLCHRHMVKGSLCVCLINKRADST